MEDATARRLARRIIVFLRVGGGWRRSDGVHVERLDEPGALPAAVREPASTPSASTAGCGGAAPGAYAVAGAAALTATPPAAARG